jgi:hypothetical protein
MIDQTRYWRVDFTAAGAIARVTELVGPSHEDWVIVEAPDESTAKRKAYNLYCARKKKLAVQRNHAAGKCCCGRAQDRKRPTGTWMLTCSVCAARHEVHRSNYMERKVAGVTDHKRDETARVSSNLERQRDRRGEIRLETLIEVRNRWIEARNVALFGSWLLAEIATLTGADTGKGAAA